METIYTIPSHSHGSAELARGHGRKSVSQRIPLQPTTLNGTLPLNGAILRELETKQHTHSHSLQTHPSHDHDKTHLEHSRSRSQLPTPSLPPPNMDPVRPKGMARRISMGLPTHLKLERSNYGYQPAVKPAYATSSEGRKRSVLTPYWACDRDTNLTRRIWFTATELTTSILVLLPYVILQASNNADILSRSSEKVLGGNGSTSMPRHTTPGLLSACALTSGTLVIVGGTSKIRAFIQGQDETKSVPAGHKRTASFTTMQVGSINMQRGRQVASRLLGVGLPFYATIHLGSDRVGLIMLVALIADIAIADNEPRDFLTKSGAKRLLSSRPWTLAAMILQAVCDLLGFATASSLSETLLGYLALSIWVFALPSPFPTMTAKKAYVSPPIEPSLASESNRLSTLKETPAATQTVSPPNSKVSPLVYTSEDVDLTLIVGLVLGLLTSLAFFLMIPIASESFYFSLIGGLLAAGASALALTTAQPESLRQSRGVGLAFGSVLSGSFLMLFGPASWIYYASQASFTAASFAAIVYDTHKSVAITSHHSHGHSHGHGHHHQEHKHSDHHAHASRISTYLLNKTEKWPLLHSILLEKDSRRIFYFMLWVASA